MLFKNYCASLWHFTFVTSTTKDYCRVYAMIKLNKALLNSCFVSFNKGTTRRLNIFVSFLPDKAGQVNKDIFQSNLQTNSNVILLPLQKTSETLNPRRKSSLEASRETDIDYLDKNDLKNKAETQLSG